MDGIVISVIHRSVSRDGGRVISYLLFYTSYGATEVNIVAVFSLHCSIP
uniref:Uncharacterized protein n=1 Tax=Arundo donax TaxID=35708 RepID=A0A0A9KEP3_ARUDO